VKWVAIGGLLAAACAPAWADEMVLTNGATVRGAFGGFQEHRFVMRAAGGQDRREFASNVRAIKVDEPIPVAAQFVSGRLDDALFTGYSAFSVRFLKDEEDIVRPATMLKRMDILTDAVPPAPEPAPVEPGETEPPPEPAPVPQRAPETTVKLRVPRVETVSPPPGTKRKWGQSGRWREMPSSGVVQVISNGEEVDIAGTLKKGAVNVVHFHMASIHSSVRQGNYIETVAQKSKGGIVVRRVVTDWKSPICEALKIDSLPQFWFYSRSGRLCRKLVSRFTESDIDGAFKEAWRSE
jgi:hypothetical protein